MKNSIRVGTKIAALGAFVALAFATSGSAQAKGRFGGGASYTGAPALAVTASLVQAGGGADNYSTATALTSMLGAPTVNAEVAKLNGQYGQMRVSRFLTVFDFAVKDALSIATRAGVTLPDAAMSGTDLAKTLVTAGEEPNGVFNTELLLDKAVTHKIHEQVMDDIDAKFGVKADKDYHRISNQAHYDIGKALGIKVKLNKLH